ncbi:DUF4842 domain-containing protein [Anaerolineales bacterium HSG6]|nr:DUF4842 domain-containing protein [Anaerolineales bacterium HSG6]
MKNRVVQGVVLFALVLSSLVFTSRWAQADAPILELSLTVSDEPLLGGTVGYLITAQNMGAVPITDKGYNLTLTNTLPLSVSFVSADPSPTFVSTSAEGQTVLVWDNIADLEVNETLDIALTAQLDSELPLAGNFISQIVAQVNTVPDNSGRWVRANTQISALPQAIDIEMKALQSTADEQASGAGEYETQALGRTEGADWPYQYQISVKNNKVGNSDNVVVTTVLPPGVAYLGQPTISPNPNSSSVTPNLHLLADGSLRLSWSLGQLTPAHHTSPVLITFDTAIPYEFRTIKDKQADDGPYAGPMRGDVIPEDTLMLVEYEATAKYANIPTSDGVQSTPHDDTPVTVTAEYLTISKNASPKVVGIGTTVTFDLNYYVSEYYTTSNVILTDVLPDGMTYVDGSASLTPHQIDPDTPGTGQTTLIWHIPVTATTPGQSGRVTFEATVDPTYEAAPYAGQPVVSGDKLTNQLQLNNHWQDAVSLSRNGNGIPDDSTASVTTRMPSFSKQVWNETASNWGATAKGFTGDTMRFRLTYDSAVDVDAKGIIIRDFLPRGMTYIADSASHVSNGTFSNDTACDSAPTSPTTGMLNGLQYLEWRICNATQGSHWEATIEASVSDTPNAQPGWIVANFGKLSGHNTVGVAYSLRDMATVDYVAPELQLTKTASPDKNLEAGDTVNFTISVTNQGDASAYNLTLVDTLPADLLIPNSGGTGSPSASSYSVTSGNPISGTGGVITWDTVSMLASGDSQTFSYNATVPSGLPAGYDMTNLASVSYNSRADNTGHQTETSSHVDDLNTDEETVHIRGVSLTKQADQSTVTIGDTVHWTLTGEVPSGFVAYWPVVEENTLPNGFDYLPGTTSISGATLDLANHAANPDDNGNNKLYWYLQSIDNITNSQSYSFTIEFDTLVTGVKGDNLDQRYYQNYCCLENTRNKAYVHWYETDNGAGSGFGTATEWDRRSGRAKYDLKIRQPDPTILKSSSPTRVEAGDVVTHTLTIFGAGNEHGYDLTVSDSLPEGTTFIETVSSIRDTPPFSAPTAIYTDTNQAGATTLQYGLNALYVNTSWQIIYTTRVDTAISAGRILTNTAQVTSYSSQAGLPSDSNGDGLPDERVYSGPSSSSSLYTPAATVLKTQSQPAELTVGSSLYYTLTIPATPISATIYEATLTDLIDSRLQIISLTNATGNQISTDLGTILPYEQRTVLIKTVVPETGSAQNGDLITNTAMLAHRHGTVASNEVQQQLVAPALTIDQQVSQNIVAEADQIQVSLTIANVGAGLAQNLVVSDTLPANMSYVAGSGQLDGQPLADPVSGVWSLTEPLAGENNILITFQVQVDSVVEGQVYRNTATVRGLDSRGQAIPADNQSRVPADTDPDDSDMVQIFGQLIWQTETTFVAYEDLKNTGWSDWDYNDLVVRLEISKGLTLDEDLAVLQIRYEALARGAAYSHHFIHDLPLEGGGTAELAVYSADQQLINQESYQFDTDTNFSIFEKTKEALPPLSGFFDTNTRREQPARVYGYTAQLTIYLDEPQSNPAWAMLPPPWDPYIFVHDTGEEVHLVIPGHLDNMQTVNGVHDESSPLLGYDLPLAQTFYLGWEWPLEFRGIWRGYPNYVDYIGSGGTINMDWYLPQYADADWLWSPDIYQTRLLARQTAPTSRYFASPVVADLNGDGAAEIVIGNLLTSQVELYNAQQEMMSGWPRTVGGTIKATAALADLDHDGSLEVLVGAGDGKLYAWHATGEAVSGWPVTLQADFRVLAQPAIADLDSDGQLDIVVPLSDGKLYALNADGSAKSGWPVSLGELAEKFDSQVINSSPRVADLDGDGSLEIVVGSTDKNLYVLNSNGSLRWTYPTGDMIFSTPAVADFDVASAGLEIAFGSGDSYVYLLDSMGNRLWKRSTGWTVRSSPTAGDLDGDGDLEIVIGSDDDKLWVMHHDGKLLAGWPQATQADIFSSPVLGDIDGDGQLEVVVGSDDAHVHAWHADGSTVDEWPKATELSVKGSPALANLDEDTALEVVAGDFAGTLYVWGVGESIPQQADLTVSLSAPSAMHEVGQVMSYSLVVTNIGPAIATGVRLTDTLPAGVHVVSLSASQGNCAEVTGALTCELGSLKPNAQARLTLFLQADMPRRVVQQVVVTGAMPDPDSSNNQAQLETQQLVSQILEPDVAQTLAYTDPESGHAIDLFVEVGAVNETVTLRYTLAETRTPPSGFSLVGQPFLLELYQGGMLVSDTTFGRPVTVSLTYTDTDLSDLDEAGLKLLYWHDDSSRWQEASCGEYARDLSANQLAVPICHLTEFALFGTGSEGVRVFLPVLRR